MVGGDLFVPKIPSMNIMELAKAICPECKTEVVGIRPGEKLHETMIPEDEASRTIEYDDHFIIKPNFPYFEKRFDQGGGRAVAEDFEYSSGTNSWTLSVDEMKEILKGFE
jgi:UDP-N-acetylglucosamine 4,6-dehydratase